MKKMCLLCFSMSYLFVSAQKISISQYVKDLDNLKKVLLKKETLFRVYKKNVFIKDVNTLEKSIYKGDTTFFELKIQSILSKFKEFNLKIISKNRDSLPFQVKEFHNKYYLTKIKKEYNYLLEKELVAIDNLSILKIKKRIKNIYYLPNSILLNKTTAKKINKITILSYLNIFKKDSIALTFILKNKIKHTIYLHKKDSVLLENISEIPIKNKLFSEKYPNKWFWTYGINFGKQVYYKHRVLLSKEYFNKMKDSTKISTLKLAKKYQISIEKVYNSPNYTPILEKIEQKFQKKRYQKLILDFRNNTIGNTFHLKKLVKTIKNIKRLHKKNKLFILVNHKTNNASLQYILTLSQKFKPIIIGNTCIGTLENSDFIQIFKLKNTKVKIEIPKNHQKLYSLKIDKPVFYSLNHYKKGIDLYLETALSFK